MVNIGKYFVNAKDWLKTKYGEAKTALDDEVNSGKFGKVRFASRMIGAGMGGAGTFVLTAPHIGAWSVPLAAAGAAIGAARPGVGLATGAAAAWTNAHPLTKTKTEENSYPYLVDRVIEKQVNNTVYNNNTIREFGYPGWDPANFTVIQNVSAEDQAEIANLTGVQNATHLKAYWDITTNAVKYSVVANGSEVEVSKDAIIDAFNYNEDRNMSVNGIAQSKALEGLEALVSVWDNAQTTIKEDWQAMYDLGQIAAKYNFTTDSDWANLTTEGTVGDISSTLVNAVLNYQNQTDFQAFTKTDLQAMNNSAVLGALIYVAETNSFNEGNAYATLAGIEGLQNYLLDNFNLTSEQKAEVNATTNKTVLLNMVYNYAIEEGKIISHDAAYTAGYQTALGGVAGQLTAEQLTQADAMDGAVDGNYTLENLLSVMKESATSAGYESGYQNGLQNLRMTEWMYSVTAPYLASLAGEDKDNVLNTWVANVDTYANLCDQNGWSYAKLDGSNNTLLLSILNDDNITNATKNYIRNAVNGGDFIYLLNTTNENNDAAQGSFLQRYNTAHKTSADDGKVVSDADFSRIMQYVRGE